MWWSCQRIQGWQALLLQAVHVTQNRQWQQLWPGESLSPATWGPADVLHKQAVAAVAVEQHINSCLAWGGVSSGVHAPTGRKRSCFLNILTKGWNIRSILPLLIQLPKVSMWLFFLLHQNMHGAEEGFAFPTCAVSRCTITLVADAV